MNFDLNVEYNPSMTEISPSNCFLLDLNSEPHGEEGDGIYQLEAQQPEEGSYRLEEETNNNPGSQIRRRKKILTDDERRVIYETLLKISVNGKLKKRSTREVASIFSTGLRTVERIWKRGKESPNGDVSSRRKNCGRKKIQIDLERIRALPLHQRTTIESISCALNISKKVLIRLLKKGLIKRHSNAIKPFLKAENKRSRLQFCLSMLEEINLPRNLVFKDMYNMVYVDEKWFFMTKQKENYYLLSDEEEPLRTCKSKNFITKVMFFAAVARPRFDVNGNETFSGKIGIFPFVTREPARRSSANRVAGTMETKPITSVTREHIKSYMIEKVIPAIKQKWPPEDINRPIFIQQDNARTHIDPSDYEFYEAAHKDGFDIRLVCQPPNSPDLNILDLGYFNAIQSLQYKESPTTIDELVDAVIKSFEVFPAVKSNRIFLTLQQCMIEIMRKGGGHDYKMKHIKKVKLEREGKLPIRLECDASLVEDVVKRLS